MPPLRSARAVAALPLTAVVLACAPETGEVETADWPAGTVLAFDGRPIAAAEIERFAARVERLHPGETRDQHRRAVLVSLVIEREALGSLLPDGRRSAWRDASAALEELRAERPACAPVTLTGGWGALGLATWCELVDAPVGEWIGPIEERGSTVVARKLPELHDVPEGMVPRPGVTISIEACHWRWAPGLLDRTAVERALDETRVVVVDPRYRELIPMDLRHRLRIDAP